MRGLLRSAAAALFVAVLATSAQAVPMRGGETTLVTRHAVHSIYARTWESNYATIRFYGGATYQEDSGIQFRLAYSIRCHGGYARSRSVVLVEDPSSQFYRGRTVRIPRPSTQGRCVLESTVTSLSPNDTDVTVIITGQ